MPHSTSDAIEWKLDHESVVLAGIVCNVTFSMASIHRMHIQEDENNSTLMHKFKCNLVSQPAS